MDHSIRRIDLHMLCSCRAITTTPSLSITKGERMSFFDSIGIDDTRIQRYAHPRAWLSDSHPPYRYHLDNFDLSSILGLCWESPWSTWQQIRSQQLTPPRIQRLNHMLKWTPILRRLFEAQTARSCDLEWRRITHDNLDWAKTSLFSVSFDASQGKHGGVLYHISTKPDQFAEDGTIIQSWSKEQLPANIAMEGYWTLLCTGLPFVDIVVAFPSDRDFITLRVLRLTEDLDIQKGIEHAARSWRERHLIQGVPPQLDGSRECSNHLVEKYRHGGQRIRRASKRIANLNPLFHNFKSIPSPLSHPLFSDTTHFL